MSSTRPPLESSPPSAPSFWRRYAGRIALTTALVLLAALVGFWLALTWDLPSAETIRRFNAQASVQIRARDGTLLFNGGHGPTRQVPYRQIPKALVQAIVATEDRRFYEHRGIDLLGIGRALVRNTEAGELREGGSTITQQLARTLFLTQERTLWRKLKEIVIAARLEQDFSKEEILGLYLNQVYFGSGAYGVTDAARLYFNKPVEKLTLVESALLAGLPQAPSRYSPLVNRDLARRRRDAVLKNLVEVGQLSAADYEKARRKPVALDPRPDRTATRASYFTAYVQSLLPELLGGNPGEGLTVETTLDPAMQASAQRSLRTALADYRGRRISQGAIIALDPVSGEIRAMVGGDDFQKSQFNRAVQAQRQPGSTFKVFVYAAALESGVRPDDVYVDAPTNVGTYEVKNYDRQFRGAMTLTEALKESRNTIAVQLYQKVGEARVLDMAQRLGIKSPLRRGAATALGASVVNLLELTSAYATLANQGGHVEPLAIRRIFDRSGREIYRATPQKHQVVSPELAATLTAMLRQVIEAGTGRRAALDRPAAGKTGTTEEHRDLLFVGYTPQLATGVWLGNDDNSPTRGTSSLAAALWGRFMVGALKGQPSLDFAAPPAPVVAPAPPPPATGEPEPPTEEDPFFGEPPPQTQEPQPETQEPPPSAPITCETLGDGTLSCRNDSTGEPVDPQEDEERPGRVSR